MLPKGDELPAPPPQQKPRRRRRRPGRRRALLAPFLTTPSPEEAAGLSPRGGRRRRGFPSLSLDGRRSRWGRLDPICCVAWGCGALGCWMGFGRRIFAGGLGVWQPPLASPHLHRAKAVFPRLLRLASGGCFGGGAVVRSGTARSGLLATAWGSGGGSGDAGAVGWI